MQMNMLKIQLLRYVCVFVSRCTYYILFIFTFIVPYTSVPPSSKPMVEAETEKASSMQRSKDPRNPNLCHLLMSEGHPLAGEKINWFFDDICFGEFWQVRFLHIWFLGLPKPLILPLDFEWRFNRVTLIPDLVFRVFGGVPPKTQRWKTWFFTRALEHRSF